MSDLIHEPPRGTPVIADVDVLVAGGGPAGIAAALSAAREGVRTMLIERYGYLGGMITGSHVVAILGTGDGKGIVAQGFTQELYDRLAPYGGVTERSAAGEYRVDPELFKWQAVEMLAEAGVQIRLHTLACEPILIDGNVGGVITESKSGREAIRAAVVVDASADADLAHRAGVPCDNEPHEVTLRLVIEGVDKEAVNAFRQTSPQRYEELMAEAVRRNGGVPVDDKRLLKGIDVADADALTHAEILLRRQIFDALTYLRQEMPGYERARIAETSPQLGVRQGRRIHGEYTVLDEDFRESRRFPDSIARLGVYFPDWGPIYKIEGLAYDLPYRCMVPVDVDGLLVVGRCVSSDYVACNTLRLIVPCFATGQAGGIAAAIAAQDGVPPRQVVISKLQESLLEQGVYLG
jgi:succinate dehydrogenase/fumarate reductase flavoprotein subunit